eukprot:365396-Chlamydomonas_euryale.AAC.5
MRAKLPPPVTPPCLAPPSRLCVLSSSSSTFKSLIVYICHRVLPPSQWRQATAAVSRFGHICPPHLRVVAEPSGVEPRLQHPVLDEHQVAAAVGWRAIHDALHRAHTSGPHNWLSEQCVPPHRSAGVPSVAPEAGCTHSGHTIGSAQLGRHGGRPACRPLHTSQALPAGRRYEW